MAPPLTAHASLVGSFVAAPLGRLPRARPATAAPCVVAASRPPAASARPLKEGEVVSAVVAALASSVCAAVAGGASLGLVRGVARRSRTRKGSGKCLNGLCKGQLQVHRVSRAAEGEGEETDFSAAIDALISKSRSTTELGIDATEWHEEYFDKTPEGYRIALAAGVTLVDAMASSDGLVVLGKANKDMADSGAQAPRYSLHIKPRSTYGLGLVLNKSLVHSWSVLGPLNNSLKALGVGSVETLTLHCDPGPLKFPFWVYDAVSEAYQQGLCSRVGVSHPNATAKAVKKVLEELRKRGVMLSCVFIRFSLLDRQALPVISEFKGLGLQVFASGSLGDEELASGRYTPMNPTGGEIGLPRFTLAQLMPLRLLFDAMNSVASRARTRCEKRVDVTMVALQWVLSKGASPLCDASVKVNAEALVGCKGWALTQAEVDILDKAADSLKKRR